MGLFEAQGNLTKSFKDLLIKWHATKLSWQDVQAEHMEKETLGILERDVRQATDAIDTISQLVYAAKRDCAQDGG
jgi:hypothetical protein